VFRTVGKVNNKIYLPFFPLCLTQDMEVSIPGVLLINGRSGEGKSHLAHCVIHQAKDKVDYAVSFSDTAFNEENLTWMPKEFCHQGYDPEIFGKILDKQRDNPELGTVLVYVDDCSGSQKLWSCKKMQQAVTAYKHYRMWIILCVHYINVVPPIIRENASQICIFGLHTKRALEAAWESYGQEYDLLTDFKHFVYEALQWNEGEEARSTHIFIYKDRGRRSKWQALKCSDELPAFYLDYGATYTNRLKYNSAGVPCNRGGAYSQPIPICPNAKDRRSKRFGFTSQEEKESNAYEGEYGLCEGREIGIFPFEKGTSPEEGDDI